MNSLNFTDKSELSFWDYKIDYNRHLGSGHFGTVYGVVKRPEEEKGYLPYFFPYLYDYIFWVDEKKGIEKTEFCVKISKSALRILLESPSPLLESINSFFQSSEEQKTNHLLRKYGISEIKFYKTNSLYSQFKTLVKGNTFHFYFSGGYFTNEKQYKLRKAFVFFLKSVLNPKLTFRDLHRHNVMYDKKGSRWEIVDGYIREYENEQQEEPDNYIKTNHALKFKLYDNITELFSILNLNLPSDKTTKYVFGKLAKIARRGLAYTEEMDQKLLTKI